MARPWIRSLSSLLAVCLTPACSGPVDPKSKELGRTEVVEAGSPEASKAVIQPHFEITTPKPGAVFEKGDPILCHALLKPVEGGRLPKDIQFQLLMEKKDIYAGVADAVVGEIDSNGYYPLDGKLDAPIKAGRYRVRIEALWMRALKDELGNGTLNRFHIETRPTPIRVNETSTK